METLTSDELRVDEYYEVSYLIRGEIGTPDKRVTHPEPVEYVGEAWWAWWGWAEDSGITFAEFLFWPGIPATQHRLFNVDDFGSRVWVNYPAKESVA